MTADATATPLVDAVLFDYGGVMTGSVGDSIRAWHTADRIDPASFSRTLKAWLSRTVNWETPIHQLETGEMTIEEFEKVFAAQLMTVDGLVPEATGILGRMFAEMRPVACLFVDDADPNVVGAQAVGLRTLLRTGPQRTRAAMAALIPALSPASREELA